MNTTARRSTRPITRALRFLGVAGLLATLAIERFDKPDSLVAALAFAGYCLLALIAAAAMEGGDTVTAPERCLTPDPFGDPDDTKPFATRIHPDDNTGA